MATVGTRLRAAGIDPAGRWLVLHPGAGVQARRYPQHHWSKLVQALAERIACPLVVIGGGHERALIDAIEIPPGVHVHSLVAQLGIGELGALLSQASLLVSSNPGTVQLAAAVGTPPVDLGAPGDVLHAPWRVPSRVLGLDAECDSQRCMCRHDQLEKLAPARVVDAVCSLLKQTEAYRTRPAPAP
jgi:ADP-heptose:LPS heptosyltransferase